MSTSVDISSKLRGVSLAARRKRVRLGRTPGSPPNREAILEAARAYFTEHGYEQATIRGIAAAAGVDPALVHHYFGAKDQLMVEALKLPINPHDVVRQIVTGPADGVGERLLRQILAVWGADSAAGGALIGLIRAAVTHDDAARMVREFFVRELIVPLVEKLGSSQPRLRAALVASQVMGLAMARFVIGIEPIASAEPEVLLACYAPTFQRYLTGPLPGDRASRRK
jgi:AcrR family transcriptional regulator